MSSQIVPFKFEGSDEVRVVMKDGEPWFVAGDICKVLELSSVAKAIAPVPEEDKGVNQIHTPGGNQDVTVLSEAGMWHLAMRSDKPRAKGLRRWLAKEVIPSIRNNGSYVSGISAEMLANPRVQHAMQIVHLTAASELAMAQLQAHTLQLLEQNQRLAAHDQKLKSLEETTAIIDDYVTIKGAAKKLGVRIDTVLAGMMGTVAGKRTKAAGLLIRDVADLQHGTVHTYPREIAEAAVQAVFTNEPQRLAKKKEKQARSAAKKLAAATATDPKISSVANGTAVSSELPLFPGTGVTTLDPQD